MTDSSEVDKGGLQRPGSIASASALTQDPHQTLAPVSNVLEVAIGRSVRELRRGLEFTVSELASAADMSVGMLSKIENGATSPSLTSLQALARALNVPISTFFKQHEEKREAVFMRAGEGADVERRGTRSGHHYRLLGHHAAPRDDVMVEPYMITLNEESDKFPAFQHSGTEFIYLLEGEVTYRHGDRLYHLRPGDSLFFDAKAPHGPEILNKVPCRYLSIISYATDQA